MPAVLSDDYVCATEVPADWEDVLRTLEAFIQLEASVCQQPPQAPSAEVRQRLAALHDELVNGSARLLEPAAIADQSAEYDVAIFARSVLVLMRLNESIAADRSNLLDTAGSRTLCEFEADFESTPENRDRLLNALRSFPEVSDELLQQWNRTVELDAQDAQRKQRVVRAIRDEFDLWTDSSQLRQNIHRFFRVCYPDTGIRATDVELIVTGCMIFFCLRDEAVDSAAVDSAMASRPDSAPSETPVRQFLKRAKKFSHWQFAHFPVFGYLRGEDLPDAWRQRLSQRSGLSVAQVTRELGRLTAIVPLHEIDKYVVHDVWGHGWQASLLRFDDLYEELSGYAAPLTLAEQTRGTAGEKMCLADCFSGHGDDLRLDEQRFERFVQLEIVERLPVAMAPVIAEVIADVAEFKYVELQPDRADALLSSSLMRGFPSKLDLIVQDVPYYFSQATKVFRLWARRQNRQQRIIDELVTRGATRSAARSEVDRALAIWRRAEQQFYASQLQWRRDGDRLHVNMMTRLALNFLGLHRAKLRAHQWVGRKHVGSLPLKSFRDLLLICAAVYFETDPPRNMWRVDEFVTLRIEPLCDRLIAAMD